MNVMYINLKQNLKEAEPVFLSVRQAAANWKTKVVQYST
jgi:hypothetical protein